ncbi:cupin domain-containing protein [Paraburkholderia kururiensis]|uniref:Cupin domain-containing protein n=1 Tax=Paraburkholderia kururiensis TaxID=984307 RepID=A0ABZ0WLI6_9BURK|nr:cupin domain-containing protein [Paraburkholderia kururiensis]WQD78209.1 cupin domain-containing protein [Paraburkholderia kururiensis]
MKVFHGRAAGGHSEQRGETFTGTVFADPVMPATNGVTINTVFFAPKGRTYWHTHEQGQVLQVTAGKGWICVEGEKPQEIRQGDIVFIGPNERHWHGASSASYMVHIATSLGKATWQEEVAESDYPKGLGAD